MAVPSHSPKSGGIWPVEYAIDAASDGGEVLICPGVYNVELHLSGKQLRIGSATASADDVALVGLPNELTLNVTDSDGLTLSNLTFRDATHNGGIGGAILASNTPLEIEQSVFQDNRSRGSGGAIYIRSLDTQTRTSLRIINSTFLQNSALASSSSAGGGAIIFLSERNGSLLEILNSTFDANTAHSASGIQASARGGAIFYQGGRTSNGGSSLDEIRISGSTFSSNEATGPVVRVGGGAIHALTFGGTMTIDGTSFVDNLSREGGAIQTFVNNATPRLNVSNSEFKSNTADIGAAIHFPASTFSYPRLTLTDSEVSSNVALPGSAAVDMARRGFSTSPGIPYMSATNTNWGDAELDNAPSDFVYHCSLEDDLDATPPTYVVHDTLGLDTTAGCPAP